MTSVNIVQQYFASAQVTQQKLHKMCMFYISTHDEHGDESDLTSKNQSDKLVRLL